MSKLLKRAKVQLSIAGECYKQFATDDAYIDACCYSLQQAIELSLKYIVEINGDDYAENHDIRANLNKLDRLGIIVPNLKTLRTMASTLYSWETESRYNDDFVALIDDIEDAFKSATALVTFADSFTSQTDISEIKEFPDSRLS